MAWTSCAEEWGTCVIPGGATADVRYGHETGGYAYVYGRTGSVVCGSYGPDFFGDPAGGSSKTCAYQVIEDEPEEPGGGGTTVTCEISPCSVTIEHTFSIPEITALTTSSPDHIVDMSLLTALFLGAAVVIVCARKFLALFESSPHE